MIPATHNFTIKRGETFEHTFTLSVSGSPIDLTGATAEMFVKRKPGAASLVELTNGNNGLSITGADGEVSFSEDTDAWAEGTYLYDLRVTDSQGSKQYYVQGAIEVLESITR